jgi:hypothetical protein
LGQSPTIPTTTISVIAIAAAAIVQLCSYPTTTAGCHQAATAFSCQQVSMFQLWENGPLCSRMLPAKAKQLTASSRTRGEPTEGSSEGSCTTDWLCQLQHHEVVAGTFFLNECPIIILFDSGASHDFMSFTCAKKAKLSLVTSGAS